MLFSKYTNIDINDVFDILKTQEQGLSQKEAMLRQKESGLNEIKAKNVNAGDILARQFKSPFFYLLFAAAVIAFLIGEKVDGLAVSAFVITNVAIGFFQEFRAEKAVFLLKKFIPQKVKVLRDDVQEFIEKKDLVPGDIVLLEAGDISPADLRVIKAHNFLIDESVLTGESVPVSKHSGMLEKEEKEVFRAKNVLFTGTSVISGKAEAVVVATGKNTFFGDIVKIVTGESKKSAYEKNILYFCKLILRIVLVTIILIFLANIILKGLSDFMQLLLFSVALIVSILPEALPAVVTFALSQGSLKMAKNHVVVKRLSAIEDLGNIDILCADKTGTLTQNKLSLEKIVTSDKKKCLLYGILSSGENNKVKKVLNPFDSAILKRSSDEIYRDARKFRIISELPFDSFRLRSSVLVESKPASAKNFTRPEEKFLIVKGAPESVLKSCVKFSGNFDRAELKEDTAREGLEGKRVLVIAYKKLPASHNAAALGVGDEKGLTFLGYFVFEDPLKSTAEEAIKLSKKLGIDIKIITGDSKEVAGYVAKKTGLIQSIDNVISGAQLEKMSAEDFEDACEKESVFARISPELKHKIIKILERRHDVGFMGEGVNDAPALKTANVGIAVLEASDIAREASDVVLLRKDLRVIVNGIKDGRAIFLNINKYIKCALASNFGNFYSIAVISLFIKFLPMLPVQILLGNLLSDFPLISIATDSIDIEELKKPKLYQLNMVLPLIISLALVSTVFDFIFFSVFFSQPAGVIQTLWFIESILTEILLIFIIRTRHQFWKAKRPSFWLFLFTILDGIFIITLPFLKIGQDWFHFVPLPILPLLTVFMLVGAYFIVSEFVKLVYFKHWRLNLPAKEI